MASIELKNVDFDYPLFEVTDRSLKVAIMQQFRADAGAPPRVRALNDVSFRLSDGARLGLVGANGAGKSSMLRLLAGLAFPSAGDLRIEGRVSSVIEKGVGINPELSAADNIELPLRLLGATSAEIENARRDVREFADLGAFFDLPVRRYSEGMKARLAFALSTAIAADVLVLDEWLSAGDAAFVERARQRLKSYLDRIKIVVIASHALDLLRKVCTEVAWFDRGHLIEIGEPNAVIDRYLLSCLAVTADGPQARLSVTAEPIQHEGLNNGSVLRAKRESRLSAD